MKKHKTTHESKSWHREPITTDVVSAAHILKPHRTTRGSVFFLLDAQPCHFTTTRRLRHTKLNMSQKLRTVQYLEENGLQPWQETVIAKMKIYTHRDINIIYDTSGTGKLGKSAFCDYLDDHNIAGPIAISKNVKNMESDVDLHRNHTFDSVAYVFDMEKAWDKQNMDFFWLFIKRLKDGRARSVSNKRIKVERPNIWIFTHLLPEERLFSQDELKFWKVIDGELSEYVPDCHDYDSEPEM